MNGWSCWWTAGVLLGCLNDRSTGGLQSKHIIVIIVVIIQVLVLVYVPIVVIMAILDIGRRLDVGYIRYD